jgi:hypothetical protein
MNQFKNSLHDKLSNSMKKYIAEGDLTEVILKQRLTPTIQKAYEYIGRRQVLDTYPTMFENILDEVSDLLDENRSDNNELIQKLT